MKDNKHQNLILLSYLNILKAGKCTVFSVYPSSIFRTYKSGLFTICSWHILLGAVRK